MTNKNNNKKIRPEFLEVIHNLCLMDDIYTEEGEFKMSSTLENFANKITENERRRMALDMMLDSKKFSLEEIVKYSKLTMEEVKELAKKDFFLITEE